MAAAAGPLLPGHWPAGLSALLGLLLPYAPDTPRCFPHPFRGPARELGEVELLLAIFLPVSAPLSTGVYFACWHAWRHLGRLRVLPQGPALSLPLPRLTLDLLPITVLALALLAGLSLWAAPCIGSVGSGDMEDFAALCLAPIAALTVPHALLMALMDLPAGTGGTGTGGTGTGEKRNSSYSLVLPGGGPRGWVSNHTDPGGPLVNGDGTRAKSRSPAPEVP